MHPLRWRRGGEGAILRLALPGVSFPTLRPRPRARPFFVLRRLPSLWTLLHCGMTLGTHRGALMRRLPPLGALEAFVAVAQRQSLKRAAEDLNLSPSALSRRVQALETHVGRRVFDRVAGEFRLTVAGASLLE